MDQVALRSMLLLLLGLLSAVKASSRDGYQVLRVTLDNDGTLDKVVNLALSMNLKEWTEVNKPDKYVDVMVPPEHLSTFKEGLKPLSVQTYVLIEDVEVLIKRHAPDFVKRDVGDSYNYSKYHNFEEIECELHRLKDTYPNKVKLEVFGRTHEKRPMYVLRVSHNISSAMDNKPTVLIDAGIHSREWVSVSTIMWIINQLVNNPSNSRVNRILMDSFHFAFMPVMNPDGYVYTWTHDRLWRKNRRQTKFKGCIGIDLNRNWDYHWGGEGTSGYGCEQDYRGPRPFSEPETRAVKAWVEKLKHKIVLYINFHAYGQLWMTPYGYSTDTPQNEEEMMKYSRIAVDTIKLYRGTEYKYGPVYTTIYPASSISVDWVRGAEDIKIAYTVELPDQGKHGFLSPEKEVEPIGEETWKGIREMLINLGVDKNLLRSQEFFIA